MKAQSNKYYICITPFFPLENNWRGAYIFDQVKAIQRNSDYNVVVFKPSNKDGQYDIDGIRVYTFKSKATPSYIFNGLFCDYNSSQFIAKLQAIGIDMQNIKYVHCHSGINGAYGLALKNINPCVKVLLQHHNLDVFTVMNGWCAGWSLNAHYRAKKSIDIFNKVDLHICISQPVKDSLLAFPNARKEEVYQPYIKRMRQMVGLPMVKPKDIYILYNGVDTSLFYPLRTNYSLLSHTSRIFRIGCIANFQELKDHITLIKAFEILIKKGFNNIRLSLLGTGITRSSCERYIRNNGLSNYIEWPQEVSHDKLPDYYRSLDLFVLPSIFEGFGCVYTESAACGVPFIGVQHQGAAEYISDEDRQKWLIKPRDYQELACKIENYYYYRYKQKLCKEYDINSLVKDFLHYLENV